ncbi:MAG: hypothetical protein L6R38_008731, partial [Xanthoria sp. 2 TBL-2021]
MAIFPKETIGRVNGPHQPSAQPINIEAWTEQATESINAISLLSSAPVRGTSVSLAIPLDEQAAKRTEDEQHLHDAEVGADRDGRTVRIDEAQDSVLVLTKARVLDRLLSNPWAQPPLPSDWEVQPTYRKHSVPYYLAPLWDAQVAARESAEGTKRKNQSKGSAATGGDGKVPKELREKLKKTKAAKGLLQDLEEQVRNFVKQWEAKNQKAPPVPKMDLDSDEEEIVFVGRNGQMHDVPQSPHAVMDDFDEDDIKRDKLVFDSLADDHGASFG